LLIFDFRLPIEGNVFDCNRRSGCRERIPRLQPAIGNWQSTILMGGPQQMSINVSRWKK
jgi:hypothetical protein